METLEEKTYPMEVRADCNSCKINTAFDYLGFQNVPKEFGAGFFLYNCRSCGSTRVLEEDQILNNNKEKDSCGRIENLQEKEQVKRKGITNIIHSTLTAGYLGLAALGFWNFVGYTVVDGYLRDFNDQFTQEKVQKELEKINKMKIYEKIFHLGSKKAFEDYLGENQNGESFINK